MRIWGAGLVVVSCGITGVIVALSYGQQVQNLRQLISFVQLLQSEINYLQTTLPQILKKLAPRFSGPLFFFIQSLRENLQKEGAPAFAESWLHALAVLTANGFPPQVIADLKSFGAVLGTSDAAEQKEHFAFLLIRLGEALQEAQSERQKHSKMWHYLGFCTGLLLTLLLF